MKRIHDSWVGDFTRKMDTPLFSWKDFSSGSGLLIQHDIATDSGKHKKDCSFSGSLFYLDIPCRSSLNLEIIENIFVLNLKGN